MDREVQKILSMVQYINETRGLQQAKKSLISVYLSACGMIPVSVEGGILDKKFKCLNGFMGGTKVNKRVETFWENI